MIKFNTIYFPVLNSTNQYLNELMSSGKEIHGLSVRTGFQQAGKGQGQNSWHSEAEKNLLLSMGFDFSFLKAARQFSITQMASLAILEVLKTFLPEAKLTVKWPNDLLVDDKKIGGMLIFNTIDGQHLGRTIIGLGINLNQLVFPAHIARPVSLKMLMAESIDIELFAQKILDSFSGSVDLLKTEAGRKSLEINYLNELYAFDQFRLYGVNGKKTLLKITGIGEFGYLLMGDQNGRAFSFDLKEIEFLF